MYGPSHQINDSFLQWISNNLKMNKIAPLFTDQYRTMLFVLDAAEILLRMSKKKDRGLFHLGGSERINRYEFGKKFCQLFHHNQNLLQPVFMKDVICKAKRSADCSLCSQKVMKLTHYRPGDIESGLQKTMKISPYL